MKNRALIFLVVSLVVGCEASSNDDSRTTKKRDDVSIRVQQSLVQRGMTVFSKRCTVCHGEEADGAGPMAQTIEAPKPADFRKDRYTRMPVDSIRRVIVQGGKATGKNPRMPAWEDELTTREVEALVAFIRSVSRFGQVPTEQKIQDASWIVE